MQQQVLDTISPTELGQKLQRVRKRQGITQAAAAELLGVARTTITAIEKGERRIKAAELLALSNAYGQPVGNFLSGRPMIEPPAVLFRSDWSMDASLEASQHIRESVEQLVELATNYYELEQLTDNVRNHYYPRVYRYSDFSGTEQAAESLAISERNRLGLGDRPIQCLRALLEESAGLRIFYLPLHNSNKFSEIYFFDQTLGGCIAINLKHVSSPGRCRWSLAHAYSHFLAHRNAPLASVNTNSNSRKPESEYFADSFAEYFLMPASSLTQCFNEIYQTKEKVTPADLVQIANDYGISFEALVRRLEGMKLVPKGIYDRLKKRGFQPEKAKEKLGLTDFPEPREMLPERYVELAMQAYDEEKSTESQLANFLQVDRLDAREQYVKWEEKAEQTGRNLDVMQLKVA
ncbi:helix-turn-helix domain-containing protein [Chloroflexi bacterium TSY]|nr:helix-turn-helix domain-containing protein [Chloroflexi bacterium TSY]